MTLYCSPGKTNCLTYTPKNINLTLSNGTLTLKAGSKVYVPNGKNADGSNKFDEVVIESDTALPTNWQAGSSTTGFIYWRANENAQYYIPLDRCTSGTTAPTATNTRVWYDTTNNLIKRYYNGSLHNSDLSLPIAIVTVTSSGTIISIDQTFDWCGYIGSTAFVLPGVKGLIPDGWNSDGTYKSIEFETSRVLTYNYTGTNSGSRYTTLNANSYNIPPKTQYEYDKTNNLNLFDGSKASDIISGELTLSSGVITSLTPYTAQPAMTYIPVNAIYNGSQKVYQYLPTGKTFNPSGSFQTYVVPKGVNKLQVDCVAAKGNGNGYGGRVQCVLSVTPGQTLYLAVGSANTSAGTPTYNASDIRTNNAGITNTTSLQSRLVVAGGGGNTGNQAGSGGHGGGLTGAAGSDVDGKSGGGGTQSAGGAGGANGYWGEAGAAGGFGLGGRGGNGVGGAGGAGWYGGGGAGASAYGSTLGGNGGGGSSYTNSSLCTNVSHTQGYRNGNGYITLTPVR